MGRIIGIDYGRKRTGIAVTDPLKIIANGLTTIPSHTVVDFLQKYISTENVDKIIVGLPKQLNGELSESMQYITPFLNRLKKVIPNIPVEMYDERFTSTLAHKAMLDGGMKKKNRQKKEKVDTIAAAIILNDYLQSNKF